MSDQFSSEPPAPPEKDFSSDDSVTASSSGSEGEQPPASRRVSKDRSYAFTEDSTSAKNPEDSVKRSAKPRRRRRSSSERKHEIRPEDLGLPKGAVLSDRTYTLVTNINSLAKPAEFGALSVSGRSTSISEEAAEEALMMEELRKAAAAAKAAEDGGGDSWTKKQQSQVKGVEDIHDHFVKILMLGDTGVGKTSLLSRYSANNFTTSMMSTVGVDLKTKYVDLMEKRVKVQVWDTAGQEHFHRITFPYYRDSNAIILTFDVSSKKTFDNIRYWMENIQQYAGDSIVMTLIGNKIDLREEGDADTISEEQGLAMAEQFGVPYLECSAKSGFGVEDAINGTTRRIMERQARGEVVQISADGVTAAEEAVDKGKKGRRRSSGGGKKDCVVS